LTIEQKTEHPVNVESYRLGLPEMSAAPIPQSDADQLEAAADQAIAACGGDAREAVKALIVANQFLKPIWKNFGLRSRRVMREGS
jgi:hypothetical protein